MKRASIGFLLLIVMGLAIAEQDQDWSQLDWPREFQGENGAKLVMYQPQVTAWKDYVRLSARVAVAFSASADGPPALGTIEVSAQTETDLDEHQVLIKAITVNSGKFPSLDDEKSGRLLKGVSGVLPKEGVVVSLERILANLGRAQLAARDAGIKSEPPIIFYSSTLAILVVLNGKPVWGPIDQTGIQYAMNTNWDLFRYEETHYLRRDSNWLMAKALAGPWEPVEKLPKAFKSLPRSDPNWEEAREHLKPKKFPDDRVPRVYMSEKPAELILTEGDPLLQLIPETDILWVKNTELDLFLSSADGRFYFLVSGRWFRAPELKGPWEFATPDLPADFARIPVRHPRGHVLASVPGTPQAEEAVMMTQIPRKAKVARAEIEAPSVTYQGDPEFESIEGTSLSYIVNSQYDVIRVGDLHYLCFQAVWFVSSTPFGPWEVAYAVPGEIYTIPASAPVHHVTYVHVYDSDPVYITYGYTSGYWGVYYSYGCVVYGTGWYYNPYVYYGSYYPVYYAYPYTYGSAAWYNPNTGMYGTGVAYYGPYGGYGYGAAYNPNTGTYARGAAAWGPSGGEGWAHAYNPRTDTYARTHQAGNSYSHWGSTVVERGNDWVRTGHYSDSRGTVRGAQGSEGGAAIGYRGDRGSGFVARGQDNDLYAGRDGNVYKRDESGNWKKHENGNWKNVDPPQRSAEQSGQQARDRASQSERLGDARERGERAPGSDRSASDRAGPGAGDRSARDRTGSGVSPDRGAVDRTRQGSGVDRNRGRDTRGQLDRDARSRSRGNAGSDRYRSWRSGGSSGGRGNLGGRAGGRRRGGRRR